MSDENPSDMGHPFGVGWGKWVVEESKTEVPYWRTPVGSRWWIWRRRMVRLIG